MLNENAIAWLAALRSGEYKQGRKALHDDRDKSSNFCCLGVACDLYAKAGHGSWIKAPDGAITYTFLAKNGHSSQDALPAPVTDWLGIRTGDGFFEPDTTPGNAQSLIDLNDNKSFTFLQIADVIESQPKGLFNAE